MAAVADPRQCVVLQQHGDRRAVGLPPVGGREGSRQVRDSLVHLEARGGELAHELFDGEVLLETGLGCPVQIEAELLEHGPSLVYGGAQVCGDTKVHCNSG